MTSACHEWWALCVQAYLATSADGDMAVGGTFHEISSHQLAPVSTQATSFMLKLSWMDA
jgi:hypothetical protein